ELGVEGSAIETARERPVHGKRSGGGGGPCNARPGAVGAPDRDPSSVELAGARPCTSRNPGEQKSVQSPHLRLIGADGAACRQAYSLIAAARLRGRRLRIASRIRGGSTPSGGSRAGSTDRSRR